MSLNATYRIVENLISDFFLAYENNFAAKFEKEIWPLFFGCDGVGGTCGGDTQKSSPKILAILLRSFLLPVAKQKGERRRGKKSIFGEEGRKK